MLRFPHGSSYLQGKSADARLAGEQLAEWASLPLVITKSRDALQRKKSERGKEGRMNLIEASSCSEWLFLPY